MIARLTWYGALFLIAAVTTFAQIDRQSLATPALASLVPEPMRGYSQVRVTALAAESDDPALALEEARKLVRRRPVPAEHLTLLAVAQTRSGAVEEAGTTIQIAAKRGWREPLAQEAVLRLALAAGDKPEAARRYTALFLRRSTPDDLLRELGPAVLGETGGAGQETLVDIISGTDRWNSLFLRRGALVMPPATLADITVAAIKRGTQFDCDVLAQTLKGVTQAEPAAGERVAMAARGQCPELGR